MLSNQTVYFTLMTSLHQFEELKLHKSNESQHQMLQVSHNMFFCVEVVRNNETFFPKWRRSINYAEDRYLSMIMLFCGRLLTDAPAGSNSVFEPLLSIPSFHFLSELQLKLSLWRSLFLVIHHHPLLASFYSHSRVTFCHLWPLLNKGEKAVW